MQPFRTALWTINQGPSGLAIFIASMRPSQVISLLLVVISLCVGSPVLGQVTGLTGPKIPLRVSVQGDLGQFWRVQQAGLREDLTGTVGYVEVQNASNETLDGVILYGKYFDTKGRLCFSLVLSREKRPDQHGPIVPDQIESFGSVTTGLFVSSSELSEVRLYLVQQNIAGQQNPQKWTVPIQAPATITGGLEDSKLQLGSELGSGSGRLLVDLVLAIVNIDENGTVAAVDVLDSASDQVRSWFLEFIQRQAVFYPPTYAGNPKSGQELVMVRAAMFASQNEIRASDRAPRMSPWVRSYVATLTDADVPPLMNIVFTRPATRLMQKGKMVEMPPAPPGLFEIGLRAGDWSDEAYKWVRDESMPQHMRRELVVWTSQ